MRGSSSPVKIDLPELKFTFVRPSRGSYKFLASYQILFDSNQEGVTPAPGGYSPGHKAKYRLPGGLLAAGTAGFFVTL
jgi:hypothetical protein